LASRVASPRSPHCCPTDALTPVHTHGHGVRRATHAVPGPRAHHLGRIRGSRVLEAAVPAADDVYWSLPLSRRPPEEPVSLWLTARHRLPPRR
jgi:hypothetical protein